MLTARWLPAPRHIVRDLARIPGDHLGAGLPKLRRAVVLRRCDGTHRDAWIKQQPGHRTAPRTRPAAPVTGTSPLTRPLLGVPGVQPNCTITSEVDTFKKKVYRSFYEAL